LLTTFLQQSRAVELEHAAIDVPTTIRVDRLQSDLPVDLRVVTDIGPRAGDERQTRLDQVFQPARTAMRKMTKLDIADLQKAHAG
jgi:hypothetical protein